MIFNCSNRNGCEGCGNRGCEANPNSVISNKYDRVANNNEPAMKLALPFQKNYKSKSGTVTRVMKF